MIQRGSASAELKSDEGRSEGSGSVSDWRRSSVSQSEASGSDSSVPKINIAFPPEEVNLSDLSPRVQIFSNGP